jgi:hypothetical protein
MYFLKGFVLSLLATSHVSAFVATIKPPGSRSVEVARSVGVEFADVAVPCVAFVGAVAASIFINDNPEEVKQLGSTLAIEVQEVSGAAPAAVSILTSTGTAATSLEPATSLASDKAAPVEVTSETPQTKQNIARKSWKVVKKVVAPWRKWENIA